jgi:hypothetical protein
VRLMLSRTDLKAVITDLMTDQYSDPITVSPFNLAERWARDVSEDIARELKTIERLAKADLLYKLADEADQAFYASQICGNRRRMGFTLEKLPTYRTRAPCYSRGAR